MINLAIGFALVTIATLLLLLSPLLRRGSSAAVDRNSVNKEIFKEQLDDVQITAHASSENQDYLQAIRTDLERSLLADIPGDGDGELLGERKAHYKFSYVVIFSLLLIPAIAAAIYFFVGNYTSVSQWENLKQEITAASESFANFGDASSADRLKNKSLAEVVSVLQANLQQKRETAEGWYLLGSTYGRLENYEAASYAFQRGLKLQADNIDLMLGYAQVDISANQGKLSGTSERLIHQVLQREPENEKAIFLLGMAYFNSQAYDLAAQTWKKLLTLRAADAEKSAIIQRSIAVAEQRLAELAQQDNPDNKAQTVSPNGGAVALEVRVDLSAEVRGRIVGSDTLYVFAKASAGPPMPLAVYKANIPQFPIKIRLDDSLAMMPELKLSNFEKVDVIARVSKHGSVKSQPGDLEGKIEAVQLNQLTSVNINIDSIVR